MRRVAPARCSGNAGGAIFRMASSYISGQSGLAAFLTQGCNPMVDAWRDERGRETRMSCADNRHACLWGAPAVARPAFGLVHVRGMFNFCVLVCALQSAPRN
jgi:hypothetical protein